MAGHANSLGSRFSLALATGAAAQSTVSGIVRDEANGVVSGASVSVLGTNGLEQQTVTGPEDGRFTLTEVPSGNLTMIVRAGGFEWAEPVAPSNEVNVVLKIATSSRPLRSPPPR